MQYFILFLTALFVSTVLVALLVKYAEPLRFVDIPDHRKVHVTAIPRVGGIGMVLGSLIALLLWLELDPSTRILLWGIGVLSVFGVLDDRFNLNYKIKLLGQFLAVLIVVYDGNVLIKSIGFFGLLSIPDYLAYPLTVFFLLGTTNAMNMSDGLDGLAAGLGLLSLACIAYLGFLSEGVGLISVCIAIIGATLGFLRYNTHPALAFMGDTGSQFLGFSVGVLAVALTQNVNTALSGALPLLILGLPIIDTLRVIGERLSQNLSPFQADRNHFHHKLLALGLDHYEAVLAIYVVQAIFVSLAFFLRYESDALIIGVYLVLSALICGMFPVARRLRWRRHGLKLGEKSLLEKCWVNLSTRAQLERLAYILLSTLLPVFMLLGVLWNPLAAPQTDLGQFAGIVLAVWIVSLLFKLPAFAVVGRVAIYSCVTLVIYFIGINENAHPEMERIFRYGVEALALLVAVGVIFSPKQFTLTPSDYLIMFILIGTASLPVFGPINFAKLAVEAALVLYAVEYVLRLHRKGRLALQAGCMAVLAMVAVKNIKGLI